MGWGRRWEGGSGWGIHVNPWLIHVSVWQKPLQYCKVISLQLIKINGKKKKHGHVRTQHIWENKDGLKFLEHGLQLQEKGDDRHKVYGKEVISFLAH